MKNIPFKNTWSLKKIRAAINDALLELDRTKIEIEDVVDIDTKALADNSVITTKIANNSVSTDKILNENVTGLKIKDGNIIGDHILPETIGPDKIQDLAITVDTLNVPYKTVGKVGEAGYSLLDNMITSEYIANEAIAGNIITPNSVSSNKFNNLSVTESKLEDYSLTTEKFKDLSITGEKFAPDSIEVQNISNNSITGEKFANGSISTDKFEDGIIRPVEMVGNFDLNLYREQGKSFTIPTGSTVSAGGFALSGPPTILTGVQTVTDYYLEVSGNNDTIFQTLIQQGDIPKIWTRASIDSSLWYSWKELSNGTVPHYKVKTSIANNLIHPDEFTPSQVVLEYDFISCGSIFESKSKIRHHAFCSTLYTMDVYVMNSTSIDLKLMMLDDNFSIYDRYEGGAWVKVAELLTLWRSNITYTPIPSPDVTPFILTTGRHTIAIVKNDLGDGQNSFELIGNIIGPNVIFGR